eukprot:2109252-Pyramimonas_sp.AAC.1
MGAKKRSAPTSAPAEPVVSPVELAAAKAALRDEAELKRQRSSLSHFLRGQGTYDAFTDMACPAKTEFLESWYSKKLTETNKKVIQGTTKEYKMRGHKKHNFQWVGVEQMQKLIGWSIEYKLFFDTGGDDEENIKSERLDASAELEGGEIGQANGFMKDIASCTDLDAKKLDNEQIKKEKGDDEQNNTAGSNVDGVIGQGTEKHNATLTKVKNNVKAELTVRSEHLFKLKEMFDATENGKFLQPLHDETVALIPKAAKAVKSLEQLHLQTSDGTTVGDDLYLAVAMQIDAFSSDYTEVLDWHKKPLPSKGGKAKKPTP